MPVSFLIDDSFHAFFSSVLNFRSEILSESQIDLNQFRAKLLSGLVWVLTVCKCYQQATPGGCELNNWFKPNVIRNSK